MTRLPRLLVSVLLPVALLATAACGTGAPSPAAVASASPLAVATPAGSVSASTVQPALTPVPGGPFVPDASVPGLDLVPTDAEADLLAGARLDLRGACGPVREDLISTAQGEIACVPPDGKAAFVTMAIFDTRDDLRAAYLAILDGAGIELRQGDSCFGDAPAEDAWLPGDDLTAPLDERAACWTGNEGAPVYVATMPPFRLAVVEGVPGGSLESAYQYAWAGNEDQPGAPTLWREVPVDTEK